MGYRHEQKVCDICGLPNSTTQGHIKNYVHPGSLQLIQAHPSCVGPDHRLVEDI
jgi:hypothetical protein